MNKHELNEKILDQTFRNIAEQYINNIANDYPSEDELEKTILFTPDFEKKIKLLLKRPSKKIIFLSLKKTIKGWNNYDSWIIMVVFFVLLSLY